MKKSGTCLMGVIPVELVKELQEKDQGNWQERVICMERVERIILKHLDTNHKGLLPHLDSLVEFICDMLKDNNIQIGNKCLNILLGLITSNLLNLK